MFAAPVLAIGAIVTSLVGGAVGAVGAISSANANAASAEYAAKTSEYQAEVAKQNATIATANEKYTLAAGDLKEQQTAMEVRAVLGNEKAAQGSSGLDVNSGSAVDVRSSSAALGQMSVFNVRNNVAREAYGYRVQGYNYETQAGLDTAQAGLDRMQASSAKRAGLFGAATSLIGGVSQAAGLFGTFQRSGVFQDNPPPKLN